MYVQAAGAEIIIAAPKFFKNISQRDEVFLIVAEHFQQVRFA